MRLSIDTIMLLNNLGDVQAIWCISRYMRPFFYSSNGGQISLGRLAW